MSESPGPTPAPITYGHGSGAGVNPTVVCRAGLALVVTGAAAAAGRTPWSGALIAAGVLLLAAGGWLTGRKRR